jgi:SAM-dependent methyltransferase
MKKYISFKDLFKNQLIKIPVIKKCSKTLHQTGVNNDQKLVSDRVECLIKILEANGINDKGLTIAEMGPGQTDLSLRLLSEKISARTSIAVDIENYFPHNHWKNSGIQFIYFDDIDSIPENSLNFIFSFDVLEHVREPNIFIRQLRRIIAKDGIIYLSWDLRDHLNLEFEERWFDMHKYSKFIWNIQMSNRTSYVNRLQKKDWENAFAMNGLKIHQISTEKSFKAANFVQHTYGLTIGPDYRITATLKPI